MRKKTAAKPETKETKVEKKSEGLTRMGLIMGQIQAHAAAAAWRQLEFPWGRVVQP